MKAYGVWRSGCIDPYFLGLGTSWRWVVSFTPRPLYPRGKSSRYPLEWWLGGPQSRPGRRWEEKILDPTGIPTPTPWSSSPAFNLISKERKILIFANDFNYRKTNYLMLLSHIKRSLHKLQAWSVGRIGRSSSSQVESPKLLTGFKLYFLLQIYNKSCWAS
jgi:hypothetical protein